MKTDKPKNIEYYIAREKFYDGICKDLDKAFSDGIIDEREHAYQLLYYSEENIINLLALKNMTRKNNLKALRILERRYRFYETVNKECMSVLERMEP